MFWPKFLVLLLVIVVVVCCCCCCWLVVACCCLLLACLLWCVLCARFLGLSPAPSPPSPLRTVLLLDRPKFRSLFFLSPALIFILFLSPGGLLWPRFKAMAPKMRVSFCETPAATLRASHPFGPHPSGPPGWPNQVWPMRSRPPFGPPSFGPHLGLGLHPWGTTLLHPTVPHHWSSPSLDPPRPPPTDHPRQHT